MEKEMKNMEKVTVNKEQLGRVLNRQVFPWENISQTLEQLLREQAQEEAARELSKIGSQRDLSAQSSIQKAAPRVASWQLGDLLEPYKRFSGSLDELRSRLEQESQQINKAKASLETDEEPSDWLLNRDRIIPALLYEVKSSIRQKAQAGKEWDRLVKDTLSNKIRELKQTPDEPRYVDSFNRLVCTKLDELEALGVNLPANKLAYAEQVVRTEIVSQITEQDLVNYLVNRAQEEKTLKIENLFKIGIERFGNTEQAETFALIMFELDQRKTDKIWGESKFIEVLTRTLRGEPLNLITMLCTINQFDYQGGYTLVPDLDAYLSNPKLEPVPLIIDELALVRDFFEFYGIDTSMDIYIADTDYTEIGQYGVVIQSNLNNLESYILNLKEYIAKFGGKVRVLKISELTDNNQLYDEVKDRVRGEIKSALSARVTDFAREWGRKFENSVEKINESQDKKKLFPKNEMRRKTLEITKNIWSVNAAQGSCFGALGPNIVMISTERRERDQNYIIDKITRDNFIAVLYVLKAAEIWNRKLTGKAE